MKYFNGCFNYESYDNVNANICYYLNNCRSFSTLLYISIMSLMNSFYSLVYQDFLLSYYFCQQVLHFTQSYFAYFREHLLKYLKNIVAQILVLGVLVQGQVQELEQEQVRALALELELTLVKTLVLIFVLVMT